MNEYKQVLKKIQLSDNEKYRLLDQILEQKNKKSMLPLKKVAFVLIVLGCMIASFHPHIIADTKKAVEEFFYSPIDSDGEILNNDSIKYIDDSNNFPVESKEYTSMEELETALQQKYLKPDLPLATILYRPHISRGIFYGYSIVTISTNGHTIDLVEMFKDDLTEENIALIQSPHHPEATSNIEIHITGYTEASNLSGENINALGDAVLIEEYTSVSLNTKVYIYKIKRMDGTYTTHADFTKDNLLYSLSGYNNENELKEAIETMKYE